MTNIQTPDVLNYLESKGWEKKQEGDQFKLKNCPVCSDANWHFYINRDNGRWDCKKCGESGNVYTLQKHLGDTKPIKSLGDFLGKVHKDPNQNQIKRWHQNLLNNSKVLSYFTEQRKFTMETIKHFQLGYYTKGDGINWAVIPHQEAGKFINAKFRTLPPADKKFERTKDCRSILFNKDCLSSCEEVIITEAETDAMTLWQNGFKNVVSFTVGAPTFKSEWYDDLQKQKKIYLSFDMDIPGQKGAKNAAQQLGMDRCYNISLDFQSADLVDANEYFAVEGRSKEDFQECLNKAQRFEIENVYSIPKILDELEENMLFPTKGFTDITPWPNVNKLLVEFSPGDLIVLSAAGKTGKTTLALEIAAYNAKKIPVFFYCLEMRPERLMKKVIESELRITAEEISVATIETARDRLKNSQLHFGYSYKNVTLSTVLQIIKEVIPRYGIKMLFFDNLHFLCRDIQHLTQEVALVSKTFKLLAEEFQIPIILIAQPRKKDPSLIMGMDDLRDSSAISTDADAIIVLWRQRLASTSKDVQEGNLQTTNMSPKTLFRVEASRYHLGGETMLYYKGEHSKFFEMVTESTQKQGALFADRRNYYEKDSD